MHATLRRGWCRADDGARTRCLLVGSQAPLHWGLIRVEHDRDGVFPRPFMWRRARGSNPRRTHSPGCRFRGGRITALPALQDPQANPGGRARRAWELNPPGTQRPAPAFQTGSWPLGCSPTPRRRAGAALPRLGSNQDHPLNRRVLCRLSYKGSRRDGGARTRDLLVPNQARFRLRYIPWHPVHPHARTTRVRIVEADARAPARRGTGAARACGPSVGLAGVEPAASRSRSERATKLRHNPAPGVREHPDRSRINALDSRPPLTLMDHAAPHPGAVGTARFAPGMRGDDGDRTRMGGFAGRCLTIRPRHQVRGACEHPRGRRLCWGYGNCLELAAAGAPRRPVGVVARTEATEPSVPWTSPKGSRTAPHSVWGRSSWARPHAVHARPGSAPYSRRASNPQPSGPEPDASTSWATRAHPGQCDLTGGCPSPSRRDGAVHPPSIDQRVERPQIHRLRAGHGIRQCPRAPVRVWGTNPWCLVAQVPRIAERAGVEPAEGTEPRDPLAGGCLNRSASSPSSFDRESNPGPAVYEAAALASELSKRALSVEGSNLASPGSEPDVLPTTPTDISASGADRTRDTALRRGVLCPLSYGSKVSAAWLSRTPMGATHGAGVDPPTSRVSAV